MLHINRKFIIQRGFWFFIIVGVLLILISTRYLKYISEVNEIKTYFYIVILTLSHFGAMAILMFILFSILIILYPKSYFAIAIATGLSTSVCLALLLDTYIYDYYRMHFNKFTFDLILGENASHIFVFNVKQYILFSSCLILLLSVFATLSYKLIRSERIYFLKKEKYVFCAIVLLMVGSHFIHAWAFANNHSEILKASRYYPLYYPTVDNNLMQKLGLADSSNNHQIILNYENKDLNYPKKPLQTTGNSKTNIILILLDSWYFKSFDSIITPNIYRFSKESELYNNHYSGSNATRSGIFSLFYSIPAIYWQNVLVSNKSPAFIDELIKNNYQITTFPSAGLTNPPFHKTVFSRCKNISLFTKGDFPPFRDATLTDNWISYTKDSNHLSKPFFAFLFYDALHCICHPSEYKGPFQPEWEYAKYEILDNNTDVTLFLNLYKNAAHFEDSLVGIVLDDIKHKGLLNNSIVIISADHGQEFNDNKKNYWGHNGNYSRAQLQVPLIIHKPYTLPRVYSHWTSHYDIVPTLMTDVFKCTNPIFDYSIGKHLHDTSHRKGLVVGSSDDFAIIENQNIITKIYYTGVYDITDSNLNPIPNAVLNFNDIDNWLKETNSFYKKHE